MVRAIANKDNNKDRKPYTRPRPQGSDGQWLHDKAPGAVRDAQKVAAIRANVAGAGITNTRIVVSNLHYEVTPADLKKIFGQIGTLVREPQIRYDRSGRSSGVAVVTFETPAEATRAKKQFSGILCKGLPMSIVYDTPPPARRHNVSLLNRIEKPPLLDRLDDKTKPNNQRAAHLQGHPRDAGPLRNKAPRGGGPKVRPPKAKPKTAADLDEELDAFMEAEVPGPIKAPVAAVDGDVEMV